MVSLKADKKGRSLVLSQLNGLGFVYSPWEALPLPFGMSRWYELRGGDGGQEEEWEGELGLECKMKVLILRSNY